MLRVQGFPPTLTAFMTSIAVLFQSVMTSARTSVGLEASAKPTIAAFTIFIVASSERLGFWCGCRSSVLISPCLDGSPHERAPATRAVRVQQFRHRTRLKYYSQYVLPQCRKGG